VDARRPGGAAAAADYRRRSPARRPASGAPRGRGRAGARARRAAPALQPHGALL